MRYDTLDESWTLVSVGEDGRDLRGQAVAFAANNGDVLFSAAEFNVPSPYATTDLYVYRAASQTTVKVASGLDWDGTKYAITSCGITADGSKVGGVYLDQSNSNMFVRIFDLNAGTNFTLPSGTSSSDCLSADGRYIQFNSQQNLNSSDTFRYTDPANPGADIYLYDTQQPESYVFLSNISNKDICAWGAFISNDNYISWECTVGSTSSYYYVALSDPTTILTAPGSLGTFKTKHSSFYSFL